MVPNYGNSMVKFSSGEITKAQTSFVEFTSNDSSHRIEYKNKIFLTKISGHFSKAFLFDSHPVLRLFEKSWAYITFKDGTEYGKEIIESIKAHIMVYFNNTLHESLFFNDYYLSSGNLDKKAFGQLIEGPMAFIMDVERILSKYKLKYKTHESISPYKCDSPKVLFFDDNFVIADDFKYTKLL